MEYPEGCSTAMRRVARKVATVKGRLVWFGGGFTTGMLFLDRWTCIWQYSSLRTEPSKSYWVYLKSYWVYPKIPWWYLGQQYINRKGSFSLLFLYHYVFFCPLRHFAKWCRDSGKIMTRDATKAQGGVVAPSPTGRSSEITLGWVHDSEG